MYQKRKMVRLLKGLERTTKGYKAGPSDGRPNSRGTATRKGELPPQVLGPKMPRMGEGMRVSRRLSEARERALSDFLLPPVGAPDLQLIVSIVCLYPFVA